MMISEYNQLVRQREKYLSEAGENNSFVKSLEKTPQEYHSKLMSMTFPLP